RTARRRSSRRAQRRRGVGRPARGRPRRRRVVRLRPRRCSGPVRGRCDTAARRAARRDRLGELRRAGRTRPRRRGGGAGLGVAPRRRPAAARRSDREMVRQRGRRAYDAYQPKRWATMKIQSLRYVITLAEELHFGRAARRHYIVPQAFGREVQRLERELGVRLFDRTSRRVALTPAGEQFVGRARRVLAQVDELARIAEDGPPPDTAVLRVGVLGFGLADRWPQMCELVAAQHPRL